MSRMPGVIWAGEQSPETPMSRYDIVCVHTIVGYAPAHAAHFSVKADGTITQSRDTAYRSAANLDGNHRVIAIENEDHGAAFGGTPKLPGWVALTDAQVESNARILKWAHDTHGIPLQLCPNSKPTSRGLAYHRQGIDGNFSGYKFPGRVSGGEVWTSSYGKVCPTDARIAQLPDILAEARGNSTEEDELMADAADIIKAVRESEDNVVKRLGGMEQRTRRRDNTQHQRLVKLVELADESEEQDDTIERLRARVAALRARLAEEAEATAEVEEETEVNSIE